MRATANHKNIMNSVRKIRETVLSSIAERKPQYGDKLPEQDTEN